MSNRKGFTLLEVLIATGILALSLSVLVLSQGRSINLAREAQYLTIATDLARVKLGDCKEEVTKNGFSVGGYSKNGTFDDEAFSEFSWECFSYRYDVPLPSAEMLAEGTKAQKSMMSGGGMGAADGMTAAIMAPFMQMMSNTLGDSIRELVVIIKWNDGTSDESLRVVTHLIDKTSMNQLAALLKQSGKKPDEKKTDGDSGASADKPEDPGGRPPSLRPGTESFRAKERWKESQRPSGGRGGS